MLWIAIGCLIGAVVLFIVMYCWQNYAVKHPEARGKFLKFKTPLQILYLLLFIAAAVCYIIW